MKTTAFVRRSRIEAPAAEVFRWHERPGAFERLTPPWEAVEVLERSPGIRDGARTVIRLRIGPFRRRWLAEHRDYREGEQFRDVQVQGPFAYWEHTHRVTPDGPDACYLEDHIEYALPGGPLGRWLGGALARNKLAATFAYRHRVTRHDLAEIGCERRNGYSWLGTWPAPLLEKEYPAWKAKLAAGGAKE